VADGFDAVWPLVSSIEGWLSREQAEALYEAAAGVEPGQWIVEIGSHHGKSTAALAKGKPGAVGLVAIDPYPEPPHGHGEAALQAFVDNMRRLGLAADVNLFWGTSAEAAECRDLVFETAGGAPTRADGGPAVGLLFVDGLHDRDSVLADIDRWEPLVAHGGLVCLHDAFFRVGVTLALLQRHLLSSWFVYERSVGNLAMFRRVEAMSGKATLTSAVRLAGRLGYFTRNMVTKAAVRRNWSPVLRLLPPEDDFEY
jgi:predicted O-methyltransferase YrrM